ncbi:DUF6385 domain-containing protein [Sinanaerobacter chloroacetimidivorans]|uniref:DUF6385 domain-containing protein n=1 Tax=Sinanaerobacter chloroacetimidivorans TaxID=2818044 RepID=A0A8J7W749_9FIRM|nr:DUF6385 domain-containing protein [Sinanaerobacter chloroacetimidivorans]MBR0600140.1 hypothetical protein [Sinanaerobacter chloroacetimidivorans]
MNNLMFNTVAEELKTSLYAQAPDSSFKALQLNGDDSLIMAGTVTVSEITAPVTIANDSLTVAGSVTVAGTVTVSEITAPVTIANDSLTVAGSVTVAGTVTVSEITAPVTIANDSLTVAGSVTVAGTVTVSEITAPVTIANDSLTVAGSVTVAGTVTVSEITAPVTIANDTLTTVVAGYSFVTDTVDLPGETGTGVAFDNTDISQIKTGTFFVYNSGTSTLTVSLQISPTTATAFYIDDPSYTDVAISNGENKIIVIGKFANYARLSYDAGAAATFSVYYNAQS